MAKKFVAELKTGDMICTIDDSLLIAIETYCEYEVDWSLMFADSMDELNKWIQQYAIMAKAFGTIEYRPMNTTAVLIRSWAFYNLRLPIQKAMRNTIDRNVAIARMLHKIDQWIYKITFDLL
jgi:hypothetical protein